LSVQWTLFFPTVSALQPEPIGMVKIAGILNLTPDSFSDGGLFLGSEGCATAVERGLEMHRQGADWVDVGGESTRPGAAPVSVQVECQRVLPVVAGLVEKGVPVSIDTSKTAVARLALSAGAVVVNDVNGLQAPGMMNAIAEAGAGAVIMHRRGTPKTMQSNTEYKDLIEEVCAFLAKQLAAAQAAGIREIWLDPGIGFGKSVAQNCALIASVPRLAALGAPVYIGASRKSFIGTLTGESLPSARIAGSLGAAIAAIQAGAQVLRVHDVAETVATIKVWEAVNHSASTCGVSFGLR
jgi:dihydropteroate synthase